MLGAEIFGDGRVLRAAEAQLAKSWACNVAVLRAVCLATCYPNLPSDLPLRLGLRNSHPKPRTLNPTVNLMEPRLRVWNPCLELGAPVFWASSLGGCASWGLSPGFWWDYGMVFNLPGSRVSSQVWQQVPLQDRPRNPCPVPQTLSRMCMPQKKTSELHRPRRPKPIKSWARSFQ